MIYIILFIYLAALLFIFMFSMTELHLAWHYQRAKGKFTEETIPATLKDESLPRVTVQLPVYNEVYVVERLMDSICSFNYPKEKLEIQILDDSTDETTAIIQKKAKSLVAENFQIFHFHRDNRKGYKAGALHEGLKRATGEFIAIFDADFVPLPDFLLKTIPEFKDANTGMVQTRWGHLNKDYSLLTQLQAFGLNAHFSVEQTGRSHAGSYINFNGTAGIWRKTCILDAGGWSADTLTEDLDLSYRAQLKGWRFKYLQEVESPAELPILMPAIKSQQYRWNKGAAETARKHLLKLFKAPLSFPNKIHAFFHLFNSTVFICILVSAILSVPILFIKSEHSEFQPVFYLGGVFIIGFLSIAVFYWIANNTLKGKEHFSYIKLFPLFLIISMGLSLHNGLAVIEGLAGIKSPFVRTPKFNIQTEKDKFSNKYISSRYMSSGLNVVTIAEAFLSLYFTFGIVCGLYLKDYGLILFHLMLSVGFALVFYFSIKPSIHVGKSV